MESLSGTCVGAVSNGCVVKLLRSVLHPFHLWKIKFLKGIRTNAVMFVRIFPFSFPKKSSFVRIRSLI